MKISSHEKFEDGSKWEMMIRLRSSPSRYLGLIRNVEDAKYANG